MLERHLNAFLALILAGILWGALGIQFIGKEEPCALCFLQRLGMLSVAGGALMNVRFGIKKLHYGISLLASVFGGFVALRQFLLHVCPGFPIFGKPVLGLSLYTWSFIVFVCCVTYIGFLLLLFDRKQINPLTSLKMNWFHHFSFIIILLAAVANIFAVLWQCNLSACQ